MDNITLKNVFIKPKLENLGAPFLYIPNRNNGINCVYNLYRENNPSANNSALRIIIFSDGGFSLRGSIRKWWFGRNSAMQDFDYKTFCSCIGSISRKLGISQADFWDSKITYLEIGGNIKLARKYEFIIPSMVFYPRLGKASFKNESSYFKGSKYELIAYDKVKEILKNNPKLRDKICKKVFIMRFEIKFKNMKGSPLGNRINTLYDLKNNWSFLIEYWLSTYSKIETNKLQNPNLNSKNKFLTRRELKDFCVAFTAEHAGIEFLNNVINTNCVPNHRSTERKHIREVCKKYELDDTENYRDVIYRAVQTKAKKMKKYSSDF